MSYAYYTCAICDIKIESEDIIDAHFDDSGEYHYDCYEDWRDTEAKKWAGLYYADKSNQFKLSASEMLDAYEPGSAKRYAMERELIGD